MATDERLSALIEVLWNYHRPDAPVDCYDELVDHLAALRAPGVGDTSLDARDLRNLRDSYKGVAQALAEAEIEPGHSQPESVRLLVAALATARRERDDLARTLGAQIDEVTEKLHAAEIERSEALAEAGVARRERDEAHALLRDFIALGEDASQRAVMLARARALVAGQGEPNVKEQLTPCETVLAARDAEIAGLKRERDAALEFHRSSSTERDTALARVAELEARDREARRLLKPGPVNVAEWGPRRDAYLSGTVPPDPARGLIERAAEYLRWDRSVGPVEPRPDRPEELLADLRAYLGGG